MTFRYWLADLISGGELSLAKTLHNLDYEMLTDASNDANERLARLHRIAALETPHANATVRKMAKIARDEL